MARKSGRGRMHSTLHHLSIDRDELHLAELVCMHHRVSRDSTPYIPMSQLEDSSGISDF